MLVTLLGTGCPQVHAHRFGPASLVQSGGSSFLIDCGSGVTQRMAAAGVSGARLDALLLTHLHSDHLVDLYQLVISAWHQGRDPAAAHHRPGRHQRLRRSDHGGVAQGARAAHRVGVQAFDGRPRARHHGDRGRRAVGRRRPSDQRVRGRPPAGRAGLRLPVRERRRAHRLLGRHHGVRQPGRRREGCGPAGARVLHPPRDGPGRHAQRAGPGERRRLPHALLRGRQGRAQGGGRHAAAQSLRARRVRSRRPAAGGLRGFRRPGGDRRGSALGRRAAPRDRLWRAAARPSGGPQADGAAASRRSEARLPSTTTSTNSSATAPSAAGRPTSSARPPIAGGPIRKPR